MTKSEPLFFHQQRAIINVSLKVPDITTEPDCGMCTVAESSQYFVLGAEHVADANWVELIVAIPRQSLFFKGLVLIYSAGDNAHRSFACKTQYVSGTVLTSKSEHAEIHHLGRQFRPAGADVPCSLLSRLGSRSRANGLYVLASMHVHLWRRS